MIGEYVRDTKLGADKGEKAPKIVAIPLERPGGSVLHRPTQEIIDQFSDRQVPTGARPARDGVKI